MQKLIFFTAALLAAFTRLSSPMRPISVPDNHRATSQVQAAAVFSQPNEDMAPSSTYQIITSVRRGEPAASADAKEEAAERPAFSDDIPLTYEEQGCLRAACDEFEVPYSLALGLIEKETDFQNIVGDHGASTGYMQIQERWHTDRMRRLGVTDLSEPSSNFRVGLDLLSELYGKYGDWSMALTVYNMGHYPGYISEYALAVMRNHDCWQELIGSCD